MRVVRTMLLLLAVFAVGCHKPSAPPRSGRKGTPTAATAKPRPLFSARNLHTAALHKDPKVVILAFTDARKGPTWMLQDDSGNLSLIASAPQAAMWEIEDLSVSPDDYYLAVVSYCEGVQVVDIFRLRDILAPPGSRTPSSTEPIAFVDAFPGGISISGWQGRKLDVKSDMPLDRLDHKTRRAPLSDAYPAERDMSFQWDIETDTISGRRPG